MPLKDWKDKRCWCSQIFLDVLKNHSILMLVPFTVPFSNSLIASLINLYKLKKVLHLEGLTDYNGIPTHNLDNNNPFQLPQGD